MSSSTIQKRLKTGKQHGLWEQRLEERDDIAAKVYTLTSLGDELFERAQDEELGDWYQSRRDTVRQIQNRERRVILESSPRDADWISEITMEEHDLSYQQQFLPQFADN
jgi:DNA-binding PadR family transcriptional regulator